MTTRRTTRMMKMKMAKRLLVRGALRSETRQLQHCSDLVIRSFFRTVGIPYKLHMMSCLSSTD